MTGGLVDPNLREALFLLNAAVTAFFEQDGSTLAPGHAAPTAAAPDQFSAEFVICDSLGTYRFGPEHKISRL